jgi:hypothetical protein
MTRSIYKIYILFALKNSRLPNEKLNLIKYYDERAVRILDQEGY